MKYTVHAFEVVKVRVPDIEAESQVDAIAKSSEYYDPWNLFDEKQYGEVSTIYGDETSHYLVDENEDEHFENSRFYMANGETLSPSTSEYALVSLLQRVLNEFEDYCTTPHQKLLCTQIADAIRVV